MTEMLDQTQVARVGIAEGVVVHSPQRIRTTGLGSCVGLVLYDSATGLAGMVHIMLPQAPPETGQPTKYADAGVEWLLNRILGEGARRARLRAKLAGGAQMFTFAGKSDIMRVGPRNTEAVLGILETLAIPVVAADVGGSVGRTIEYDPLTELLHVRTALRGSYTI